MFTQCQHCLTIFRITPEQLKAADAKVRCCRCNNTFNALNNLMESPVSFVNDDELKEFFSANDLDDSVTSAPQSSKGRTNTDGLPNESALVSDSEIERSLDALADEQPPAEQLSEESILEVEEHSSEFDSHNQFLLERDDGLETEPEYFAAGTESQMSELLDRDTASALLNDIDTYEQLADVISIDNQDKDSNFEVEPKTSSDESVLEEDSTTAQKETVAEVKPVFLDNEHFDDDSIPSNESLGQEAAPDFTIQESDPILSDETLLKKPDSLDQENRFTFEKEYEQPQSSRYARYWATGSIILLLLLAGQTAWFLRDTLITHDAGRQVLEGICSLAFCEMPIRRDTGQIIISDRALTTHPEIEGILSLKLQMVNTAVFQQPFPKLQLSLFNDMGTIIARRTFKPHEYSADQYASDLMMPRLRAVNVVLELKDPGDEVTGFKFDFL
jgi:predicted Zn finger-like uncharacterized protein